MCRAYSPENLGIESSQPFRLGWYVAAPLALRTYDGPPSVTPSKGGGEPVALRHALGGRLESTSATRADATPEGDPLALRTYDGPPCVAPQLQLGWYVAAPLALKSDNQSARVAWPELHQCLPGDAGQLAGHLD